MSDSRRTESVPQVIKDRIRDDDSKIVERLVALLLAFWMGGLMMVSLGATGSFEAVQSSMDKPPMSVARAMAKLGAAETRDLLHSQSSEVNRHLFEFWGWIQLGLTSAIFAALLFMTNSGKKLLGVAAGMCGMSAILALFLIPGMIRIGRELRAHSGTPGLELRESFQNMHRAFGAFEAVAVLLGLILLVALLRSSSRSSR